MAKNCPTYTEGSGETNDSRLSRRVYRHADVGVHAGVAAGVDDDAAAAALVDAQEALGQKRTTDHAVLFIKYT